MLSFYIYIAIFRHSTDKNENFGFAGLISCLNALYVDRVYQKCSPVSVMLHTTLKKKKNHGIADIKLSVISHS